MSTSSEPTQPRRGPSWLAIGLLLFVVANGLVINFALPRLPFQPQITTTLSYADSFFKHGAHSDSWKAMRTALFFTDEPRTKPIYTALYFENNVRFQYPPSSLLVLKALRGTLGESGISNETLNGISWLCVWAMAAVLGRVFFLARRRFGIAAGESRTDECLFAVLAFAITLTFYPVVRGYYLGQIQVWIDLLITLVVWSWLENRRATAGVFISLVCVIKPTLALVVVWGAFRRQWDFIKGFAIPMSGFAVVSLAAFGWENHTNYLSVLSYISQQGEIFHPNQSMNGLLHRLIGNGNSIEWERNVLMAYNPWVHGGTVVSTIALMFAGLFSPRSVGRSTGPIELAIIIVCATLASPTVWTHHYGVMLPLFAVALPCVLSIESDARKRCLFALAACFVLIGTNFRVLNRLSETDFNFLQSYVYFAGLGFLGLLLWLRTRSAGE